MCPYSEHFGEKMEVLKLIPHKVVGQEVIRMAINWDKEHGLNEIEESFFEDNSSQASNSLRGPASQPSDHLPQPQA